MKRRLEEIDFHGLPYQLGEVACIDLSKYEREGAVLPTLNAVFNFDGYMVHGRTIVLKNVEYNVFCCVHGEYIHTVEQGGFYLVFKGLNYYKSYDNFPNEVEEDELYDAILQAFGEAYATEEHSGLMRAEDYMMLKGSVLNIGTLLRKVNAMEQFMKDKLGYKP